MILKAITFPVTQKKQRGLYFICTNDEIIYIGQSTHLQQRIIEHSTNMIFLKHYRCNKIYTIELPCADIRELLDCEKQCILFYEPKENWETKGKKERALWKTEELEHSDEQGKVTSIKLFTIETVAKLAGISIGEVLTIANKKNITYYSFGKLIRFTFNNAMRIIKLSPKPTQADLINAVGLLDK